MRFLSVQRWGGGGGLCQDGGLVREIWELKASEGVEVEAEGKERRIFF